MNGWPYQLNRRTKHGWQYGLSFSSLNVPLLSWHWQCEQTKCSGWYLRYMAVMQRPVTGLWHAAQSDPRWAWKCVSQYGRPSCSKNLPLPNGIRHFCRCTKPQDLTIIHLWKWDVKPYRLTDCQLSHNACRTTDVKITKCVQEKLESISLTEHMKQCGCQCRFKALTKLSTIGRPQPLHFGAKCSK